MSDINHETYKVKFRDLTITDAKKGFKGHLTSFIIMNTILVIVNLSTDPSKLWCLGPCGAGIDEFDSEYRITLVF